MADVPAATYWRYEDANGVHVVDSLDNVPARLRSHAAKISLPATQTDSGGLGNKLGEQVNDLADGAATQVYKATGVTYGAINKTPLAGYFSAPGASATAGGLLALGLGFAVLRRKGPLWLKLVLGFLAVGMLGGAYLGWTRRAAGLSDAAVATPQQILDDTRRVVEESLGADDYEKALERPTWPGGRRRPVSPTESAQQR